MKWFQSLRWQLFILFFLVSAIPLVIFSALATERIETYFIDNSKTEWIRQGNLIASQISQNSTYLKEGTNYTYFANQISEMSQNQEGTTRIVIVDELGYVVADSSRVDLNSTLMNTQVMNALNKRDSAERFHKEEQAIMSIAVSITDRDNSDKVLGVAVISTNIDSIYKLVDEIETQIYLLSFLTSLLIGLLSFFSSSIITRPLKSLMKCVEKITNGQLNQKIELHGKGEMVELSHAFNHMADQLQLVEESRQEFVSNVSHELKTPLASIKVLTESLMFQDNVPIELYEEFFYDINSEVDRLNAIITDLLDLVKLDQDKSMLHIASTDLNSLIQAILKRLDPLAKKKDITLIYQAQSEIYIEADEVKLTLAISNLIENGVKYTPDGGQVEAI
ncbi:MAG: histidine kinase [Epulopiscium sp. Nele67-Bin005]|nr:MAG: histidine kinase [Epulopiscium sp. Nele67-Bin005]